MKLVISYKTAVDQTDKFFNLVKLVIDSSGYLEVPGLDDIDLDPYSDPFDEI